MSTQVIIFGGASIGTSFSTKESVVELGEVLKSHGISRIDSAARYGGESHLSETLIGHAGFLEKGITIDTKINFFGDGSGTLSAAAIEKSLEDSFTSLRVSKVYSPSLSSR